jgi:arogenate/prephenate dehydratase
MRSNPISVVQQEGGGGESLLRFSYLFYADLAASTADQNTQNALRHLQEMAPFLRVLGCYRAAERLDV